MAQTILHPHDHNADHKIMEYGVRLCMHNGKDLCLHVFWIWIAVLINNLHI